MPLISPSIVTEFNALHPENVSSFMIVTDAGILTDSKFSQSLNAATPISSTEAAIVTFSNSHSVNALSLIATTGLPSYLEGIITSSSSPLYPITV